MQLRRSAGCSLSAVVEWLSALRTTEETPHLSRSRSVGVLWCYTTFFDVFICSPLRLQFSTVRLQGPRVLPPIAGCVGSVIPVFR